MPRPGPTSLIDEVDDSNQPIGTVPRADAFIAHANFRTVHVLVFSPKDELLLQQLSRLRERNPLEWGSSVAGYLYAGETYANAAKRRLREELGLETHLEFVGVTPMKDEDVTKFVGVYTTTADHPYIAEPDHIARIEFRPIDLALKDVGANPKQYTDTLRHVLKYWVSQGRPGEPRGQ